MEEEYEVLSDWYCAPSRGFFTKEERIKMLKEYKEQLDLESKGVAEKIMHLEKQPKN